MTSIQCNVVTIFLFVLCSSVTGNRTVLNDSKVRQYLAQQRQQQASSRTGDPCHGSMRTDAALDAASVKSNLLLSGWLQIRCQQGI
ncbi:hypothetical protein CEXT_273661, partial [Caerostris extrusa]